MKPEYFHGAVHQWFGLTYSSYLVLPRSLLQGMPLLWQKRFVHMLTQMAAMYEPVEDNYTVNLRGPRGRFKPDSLSNYRRPPPLPYRGSP